MVAASSPAPPPSATDGTGKDGLDAGDDDDSDSDSGNDDDDDDDPCFAGVVTSVRSDTGLETAVVVRWPGLPRPLRLSTCLPAAELAPLFHGTQWAGTRVWRASLVALRYLASPACPCRVTPATALLELGAGLAVPSLALRALTGCAVVATDRAALLAPLRANLAANSALLEGPDHGGDAAAAADPENAAAGPASPLLRACALDWSRQGVEDLLAELAGDETLPGPVRFDIVLNCDCLFEPLYGPCDALVACQEALLQAFPRALVLTVCERRNHDGIDRYLRALAASDAVGRVEQLRPTAFDYPPEVELYRLYAREDCS